MAKQLPPRSRTGANCMAWFPGGCNFHKSDPLKQVADGCHWAGFRTRKVLRTGDSGRDVTLPQSAVLIPKLTVPPVWVWHVVDIGLVPGPAPYLFRSFPPKARKGTGLVYSSSRLLNTGLLQQLFIRCCGIKESSDIFQTLEYQTGRLRSPQGGGHTLHRALQVWEAEGKISNNLRLFS